jgi:hypothetical protein
MQAIICNPPRVRQNPNRHDPLVVTVATLVIVTLKARQFVLALVLQIEVEQLPA